MRQEAVSRSARIARLVWLAMVGVGSILVFAGPVSQWRTLHTACYPVSSCLQFQLSRSTVRTLGAHGISPAMYAALIVAVLAAVWVLWYGLSTLIILRRPDDRGALLAAFFLALFPSFEASAWLPSGTLASWAGGFFVLALLMFVLLFPDGRFAPPWTRWLAGFVVVFLAITSLPTPPALYGPELVATLAVFVAVVGAQVYRYRAISTATQQQQIKWALVGLAIAVLGLGTLWYGTLVAPFPTSNGSFYAAFSDAAGTAVIVSSIPVFIAVAVLHNHLWDIDRIISRALTYTILTVTIAGIYVASVIGLQGLSSLVVGHHSDIAIAISTLAIAALFGPLRRRVQTGIDRRFYRSRYDAQRIMSSLGERLRDEVDMNQLSDELTLAIHETLHPAHMTLWIRDADGQRSAPGGVML
jgi:hypothetical protein